MIEIHVMYEHLKQQIFHIFQYLYTAQISYLFESFYTTRITSYSYIHFEFHLFVAHNIHKIISY